MSELKLTTDETRVSYGIGRQMGDQLASNPFDGVSPEAVAQGVVDAYKNMGDAIKVPIIVRLQGTNAEEAKKLIDESGLKVQSAIQLSEAAALVKQAVA